MVVTLSIIEARSESVGRGFLEGRKRKQAGQAERCSTLQRCPPEQHFELMLCHISINGALGKECEPPNLHSQVLTPGRLCLQQVSVRLYEAMRCLCVT